MQASVGTWSDSHKTSAPETTTYSRKLNLHGHACIIIWQFNFSEFFRLQLEKKRRNA